MENFEHKNTDTDTPNKDPTFPSSYHPLSLAGLICKAPARRSERITPYIINPDQTGFIKGRRSTSNTCRLISLTDYASSHHLKVIIVSQDEEKAFDRVNWKFLNAARHKFDLETPLYPGLEQHTAHRAFLLRPMIKLLQGSLYRQPL